MLQALNVLRLYLTTHVMPAKYPYMGENRTHSRRVLWAIVDGKVRHHATSVLDGIL